MPFALRTAPLFLGLIWASCFRPTGFCLQDSDCTQGQLCYTGTGLCGPSQGADLRADTDLRSASSNPALLIPSGPAGCNYASVAIAKDTVLLGASIDEAAYVFFRSGSTWIQQARLTASDGASGDEFGWSVALSESGDTAVVGAYVQGMHRGAAYVFSRSGKSWAQQDKLLPTEVVSSEEVGYSVAATGDTAVLGARGKDGNVGAAYVYTRLASSWSYQTKLLASDRGPTDNLGTSVAASGDTVLIGGNAANRPSAAYIFVRNGNMWGQEIKLVGDDSTSGDAFGWAAALSGDTALVGAVFHEKSHGAGYIFARAGSKWTQQGKLSVAEWRELDRYGWSVAVSGEIAVLGSPQAPWVEIFTRGAGVWTRQPRLATGDAPYSLGLSGTMLVICNARLGRALVYDLARRN